MYLHPRGGGGGTAGSNAHEAFLVGYEVCITGVLLITSSNGTYGMIVH